MLHAMRMTHTIHTTHNYTRFTISHDSQLHTTHNYTRRTITHDAQLHTVHTVHKPHIVHVVHIVPTVAREFMSSLSFRIVYFNRIQPTFGLSNL